jgi:hypothetical protein
MIRTDMVLHTFMSFDYLSRLMARENFTELGLIEGKTSLRTLFSFSFP